MLCYAMLCYAMLCYAMLCCIHVWLQSFDPNVTVKIIDIADRGNFNMLLKPICIFR